MRSLLIFFIVTRCFSQGTEVKFYEIIKDDSIVMFFNDHGNFTAQECSQFVRHVTVDQNGKYNGLFLDTSIKNVPRAKGSYSHGAKHGATEVFYPNGKLQCRGYYSNNFPVGKWEYWYENGLPERTLNITDSDTLLVRFIDPEGNVLVENGNGRFEGRVAGYMNESVLYASGELKDGRPEGKWTSQYKNVKFCNETFQNGRLISGSFPNTMNGFRKNYSNRSFLKTFFFDSYLSRLEELMVEKCAPANSIEQKSGESPKTIIKTNIPPIFYSSLRQKIDKIIESDLQSGNNYEYNIGESNLTIMFKVGNDGKPHDFSLVSGWGQQFFSPVISAMGMHTTFAPTPDPVYFHLKFQMMGGGYYKYNFTFSRSRNNN